MDDLTYILVATTADGEERRETGTDGKREGQQGSVILKHHKLSF